MYRLVPLLLLLLSMARAAEPIVADSDFLQPYVRQLKSELSRKDRETITSMAESELILLHLSYGMSIRNRWLHGDRDPTLIAHFQKEGVLHPDTMSMIIIRALWQDLNSELGPAQRKKVEEKRALVARRRAAYERAEAECSAQLVAAKQKLHVCYPQSGLAASEFKDPFRELVLNKSGKVRRIEFWTGTSHAVRKRLNRVLKTFSFSPFQDDETITLYILEFPQCRVSQRDTLHSR